MTVFTATGFIGRLWRRTAAAGVGLALAALATGPAHAQLRVDISGVGATQYPIAIADFSGASGTTSTPEVIRADLTRSGQFRLISAGGASLPLKSTVDYGTWQARGADYLALGSVEQNGGQYTVSYRLVDRKSVV